MKKRIIAISVFLAILLSLFTLSAFAAGGTAFDGGYDVLLDGEENTPDTETGDEEAPCTHSYKEQKEDEYIKELGTHEKKTTYWYSCELCGASCENDDAVADKFFEGDIVHQWSEKYSNYEGEHWRGCTVVGCQQKIEKAACSGGEATCIAKALCEICAKPYGELAEHILETEGFSYKNDDGHAHQCTVCRSAHDELVAHTPDREAATETEPVKCEVCGHIIEQALGHGDNHELSEEWTYNETAHWHSCTGCNNVQDGYRPHNDKDKDGACDDCGYPVPVAPVLEIEDKLKEVTAGLTKEQVIYIGLGAAAVILLTLIIRISILVHRRRKW